MTSQDVCGITSIEAHTTRRACQKHVVEAAGMAGAIARAAEAEGRPWLCRLGKNDGTILARRHFDEKNHFGSCLAVISVSAVKIFLRLRRAFGVPAAGCHGACGALPTPHT